MLISIPPKYAMSQVIGFIKGKSAVHLARVYGEKKRNFVGQHFWARGYFVSTVGRDTEVIRFTLAPSPKKFFEGEFRQIRPYGNRLGVHSDPCACTDMCFRLGPLGWA
jgi:hypothetical protein